MSTLTSETALLQPKAAAPVRRPAEDHLRFVRRLGAAVLILAFGVILLAILPWPPGLTVVGNVVARTVVMDLSEPLDLDIDAEIKPADVTIHGATRVTSLDDAAANAVSRTRLTGTRLRLSGLHVLGGGTLTLSHGPNGLAISVGEAGASIDFEVARADPAAYSLVTASTDDRSGPPLLIQATDATGLELDDFDVSRLRFGQYRGVAGNGRPFSSSIMAGSVTLVETGRTEKLEPGGAVALDGFNGSAVRITLEPEGVHVWFTGSAAKVSIGSPGLLIDTRPGMLEVLYHRPGVRLAFGFVSSILSLMVAAYQWHAARQPA